MAYLDIDSAASNGATRPSRAARAPVGHGTPLSAAGLASSMDHQEAHSRAMIASALIVSGAVAVPSAGSRLSQADGRRLRELTDHLYRLVTSDEIAKAR